MKKSKLSDGKESKRQAPLDNAKGLSLSVSEEQYELLRRYSYLSGDSMSKIVNTHLDWHLLRKQVADLDGDDK